MGKIVRLKMLYILSSIRQGGFIQMGEHLNQLPHHGFSILRQMAEQPNGRGWRGPDICLDLQRFNEKQQFFQPFFSLTGVKCPVAASSARGVPGNIVKEVMAMAF